MTIFRSGYSFRTAVGHLPDCVNRLKEIGATSAAICDRNSTFGFVKFTKLCKEAGIRPIYGVEIGVTARLGEKKQTLDFWKFLATDSLVPLHNLLYLATSNPGKEPSITYEQAFNAIETGGLIAISGERLLLDHARPTTNFFVGLSPATPKGLVRAAADKGLPFFAINDNVYPRSADLEFYRVALGWRGGTQTYPRHILSEAEWRESVQFAADERTIQLAWDNGLRIGTLCTASLQQATLLSPDKPKSLRQLCEEGAVRTGTDLNDPVYAERLAFELNLIAEKQYENYFFILEDMMKFARSKMFCGPARGSSCGSLVCFLLDITTVDPIPEGLLFQRFIDVSRIDPPDVDVDLPDDKRDIVFEYMENKYGKERVARLGTVGMFKPRSAIATAGIALDIPKWKTEKVLDSLIVRSSGDSRAMQQLEDTLGDTEAGRKLKEEHPEILIATRMEGHPNNPSQHAAGIVVTAEPVRNFVAVDARTGATFCDKKDAEGLNLLKIDALGLTQLSIFARCLELVGQGKDLRFLDNLPRDDQAAFDILNKGHFSGVFQFTGPALKSLTKQINVNHIDDMVAITALARPGPMASGGANEWVKRRTGAHNVSYPHPVFEPYLKDTLGIVIYQEQVMQIGREIGDLSWDDVTQLRKAMSKSLGKEYFDKYGDKWKVGAAKKGIPPETRNKVWDDLCLSGDTKIKNPFPAKGSYRYITLKQLYEWGGQGPSDLKQKSKRGRRQSLLAWDGTTVRPMQNWGIRYSGKKQTYTLLTESGNEIHATEEHKFLQLDGDYVQLKNLKVGGHVMSVGETLPTERKRKKGTGTGGHNWWHSLQNGAPNYKKNKEYLRKMENKCARCRKAPYQETHHINMDHTDNRLSNLMPVCRKCHKALHAIHSGYPYPWKKGRTIYVDRIVSIKKRKVEDVYDVHMPDPYNNFEAEGIIVHNCAYGSWSFNKSHAVAYGRLSYQCAWLKAHHPVEFAAATLDAAKTPDRQIELLREMKLEGVDYVPVDPAQSEDRWTVGRAPDGRKLLIGPLTSIRGIGPAKVAEVMACRRVRKPIKPSILKALQNAKTDIDSLTPIRDAIRRLHPDLTKINIFSTPINISEVQCGFQGEFLVFGILNKIAPRDENEAVNVAKRGGRVLSGPTKSLNLFLRDDTDEVFGKVDRWAFNRIGQKIVELGVPKRTLVACRGTCPADFRMIKINQIRILGRIDD